MAERNRKKDYKAFSNFFRYLFLWIIILLILSAVGYQVFAILKKSPRFRVKDIVYSKSLQYINPESFERLKGRSIFDVDIKYIEGQLKSRYPQTSHLKVFRNFPNQIVIYAKERKPFLQTKLNRTDALLDEQGTILALLDQIDPQFPYVTGIRFTQSKPVPGTVVRDKGLMLAVKIIKDFRRTPLLASFQIQKMDMTRLSEITFYLNPDLRIIIDQDDILKKMNLLGLVLSQVKSELADTRYIDLRFQEPILGKNNDRKNTLRTRPGI